MEGEPRRIHRDIWDYWKTELSPYFDEEYLEEEMQRYREHAETWPEGEADYKRLLNKRFIEVKEFKEKERDSEDKL